MSGDDCREGKKYSTFERFVYEIKKLVPIFVVVLLASSLLLVDTSRWYTRWIQDIPQLVLAIISLSVTAFILGVIKIIITWLFPGFHFALLLKKVEDEANLPAAITIVIMLVFIMFLIWITIRPASASEIVCHDKVLMKARPYLPMINDTFNQYWPDASYKQNEPGKLDRETACPNMKKCWNPKVQLKTSREWGIGLSEVTIAYNKDGTVRFNNFVEAKRKYKEQLAGWNFEGEAKYEAKYHIIYSVLEDKSNFQRMKMLFVSDIDRWAGTLVSYNAGAGRVNSRFTICKITPNCDKGKWFGGLDTVASLAEKNLIYGVSLQQRVNDYPRDVIFIRSLKYKGEI
jgi:hypothetical protein